MKLNFINNFQLMPWGGSASNPGSTGSESGTGNGYQGAIAGGAMSLMSNVLGMVAAQKANEDQQDFANETWWRNRQATLDDWHMTNAYNSPAAQMARLKAAGLNPNLVFGNGAINGSAGSVQRPEGRNYDHKMPPNFSGIVQDAVSTSQRIMQQNLAEKQLQVMDAEIRNKDANSRATLANAGIREFDLGFREKTQDFAFAGAEANSKIAWGKLGLIDQALDFNEKANPYKLKSVIQGYTNAVTHNVYQQTQIAENTKDLEVKTAQINYLNSQAAINNIEEKLRKADLPWRTIGAKPTDILNGAMKIFLGGKTGVAGKAAGGQAGFDKAWSDAMRRYNGTRSHIPD